MGELAAIAEAFSKYGAWAFVAMLLVTVKVLYTRNTQIQDARLADMKEFLREGIRAQEASAHALDKLEDVVKAIRP
jgi:hypothetical protein